MRVRSLFSCVAMLSALVVGVPIGTAVAQGTATGFEILFPTTPQDARSWLSAQGFQYKIDAGNASKAKLSFGSKGLVIETMARAEPLIIRGGLSIRQPATLAVTWGVNRYPTGANWDRGVNNEAIMVMVQFGTQTFSGGFFVPPAPYFIGFFLCDAGRRNVFFTGRSYTRQGRYICLDRPVAGSELTSTVNLDEQFRAAFGSALPVPPVTGIGIESDTTQVSSDGRASAWVRSISIKPR